MKTTEEMIELIYNLFNQSCRFESMKPDSIYDHMFISVYEEAQAFLIEVGRIEKDECKY